MPSVAERYFTAADALLRRVRPTWWGAVVTDDRFRDIYDLNYARVTASAPDLRLVEVLDELRPDLEAVRSRHLHVVVLGPDGAPRLVEEAGAAGHRISRDTVMEFRGLPPPPHSGEGVEEADPADPRLWDTMRFAYREFDVTAGNVVEQLLRWNREVLVPGGRRYFIARRQGRVAGMGAVQVRDGVAYVDDVVTFPEHRRRGVASSVVRRILRESAASAGATFLLADRPDPIRLYRTLGFVETGRLVSTLYATETTGSGAGLPR
ncbi:MAG: GNAT family N-acetyltransferase [Actinomycetota bacterium]